MKIKELRNLGMSNKTMIRLTQSLCKEAAKARYKKEEIRGFVIHVLQNPEAHTEHPLFAELALALTQPEKSFHFAERKEPAPWKQWGKDLEATALQQMENACRLPVAHSGALMPDAHPGYGLPIGGVLATENAIIPFAVGVDIACRMRMTVFDMPVSKLKGEKERLIQIIEDECRFGLGASFAKVRDHGVMYQDWKANPVTAKLRDKAWNQLGTSGTGNHFVEFGTFSLDKEELGLPAGEYVALLSHSGSRGSGAAVANYYSKLAVELHPELPKELQHLAWLDMDKEEGQEYWYAMNLMGAYAAANHEVIHREIQRSMKSKALLSIENHHNFAWKEIHHGKELIVHRKGATPAGVGVLGIIPGSMATPGFVVRGKGNPDSLHSASHGAGRVMSRAKAKEQFTWSDVKKDLKQKEITLISAGIDEVPGVYKDIHQVMQDQVDLVDILGMFKPKIVKMAPAGEKAED